MIQEPKAAPVRPTFLRTALVVGAAVVAAAGGGMALAHTSNSTQPEAISAADPTTTTTVAGATTTVAAGPAAPSTFVGIPPVRVLDTRNAAGGPIGVTKAGPIPPNTSIDVKIGGEKGIPANATSVAVNITIDQDATVKSFLTVWPTGQARPGSSANNAEPGLVAANSALFQLGTGGQLSVYNQLGNVNVIMDVTGYFTTDGTVVTPTTTSTTMAPTTTTTSTTAAPAP